MPPLFKILMSVAKMVINDFLRGKLPWYIPDPSWPERKGKEEEDEFDGAEGKLGEKRNILAPAEGEEEINSETDGSDDLEDSTEENEGEDGREESSAAEGDEGNEDERIKDTRPPKKLRKE